MTSQAGNATQLIPGVCLHPSLIPAKLKLELCGLEALLMLAMSVSMHREGAVAATSPAAGPLWGAPIPKLLHRVNRSTVNRNRWEIYFILLVWNKTLLQVHLKGQCTQVKLGTYLCACRTRAWVSVLQTQDVAFRIKIFVTNYCGHSIYNSGCIKRSLK